MVKGKVLIDVNDIIGKRLGKLKVVRYYGKAYDFTAGGERLRHYYVCQCECGRTKIIQRGSLVSEIIYSCGCSGRNKYGN